MTYNEICVLAKTGNLIKLPNFEGYFKWDYAINDLVFYNGSYKCRASDLDIKNRTDFYYII